MKSYSPILPLTNPYVGSSTEMPTMFLQRPSDYLPTTRLLISPSIDDDKPIERKPLLSRAFSFNGGIATTSQQHQRRRRTASDENLLCFSNAGEDSITSNVEHAASETYLVTRLCLKLLRYLGVGYRWITRFLALGCYAILLMPGFFASWISLFLFKSNSQRYSLRRSTKKQA